MIHEKVGDYISRKIGMNSYDYYLGLLAPDTPNLEGFGPKEERWMAHQRKKDLDEWRDSLQNFYNKEKENHSKDFLLGYYIHILTDIIYDDFIYKKVRKVIEEKYSREESHNKMREDMDHYYFEESERIKEILNQETTSYNILNIEKEKLHKWKEKEINKWPSTNTSTYITEEVIEELQEKVYEELKNKIEV